MRSMRSLSVSAGFLCIAGSLFLTWLCFSPPSDSEEDFAILPSSSQNIGEVRQGTSTDVDYSLKNITTRHLKIVDIATTCGCTTASAIKKDIAPGDVSVVRLTFSSGQFRGPVRANAQILYTDGTSDIKRPKLKSTRLEIQGQIDPDFEIEPEHIEFTKSESKLVVVRPRYTNNFIVTKVVCDKRFFASRIIEQTAERVKIEVTFDASEYYDDAGPAHLSIHTNSVTQPVAYVPIDVAL